MPTSMATCNGYMQSEGCYMQCGGLSNASMQSQGEGHMTDFSALLPGEFYPNPFLAEPTDGGGPSRAGPCWSPVVNG